MDELLKLLRADEASTRLGGLRYSWPVPEAPGPGIPIGVQPSLQVPVSLLEAKVAKEVLVRLEEGRAKGAAIGAPLFAWAIACGVVTGLRMLLEEAEARRGAPGA